MSTPYERGSQDIAKSLDAWEELGWSSMQEASQAIGDDLMEELAHAKEMVQRDDLSEREHKVWTDHIEYFEGGLSRLD